MGHKIDADQVRQVAKLSRLELTGQEIEQFAGQLSEILGYFEKLNELDTSQVQPLAHCLPIHNVFREDQIRRSLSTEEALANAPDREDEFYKVPKILDDNSGA
ncbi:MAG: Asp-tRNA(Asn)/Glu-tRNA(Gln) amidotransferase subunit GatC [Sedimentisphaerales bacterium]|nr:Asp-tRNA(Asn)/Glu-tRNA(Gln) amidotransferase subunit GatC [Sedimentisphaerales bacterium]